MKISIITGPWLPVPALRGGAMQKSWHAMAREFVRSGHEVAVISRSFSGQPAKETIDGIQFLRTRGFAQGRRVAWDLVKDLVYAANVLPRLPVADILVTNDFWLPALAAKFRPSAGAVVVSAGRFPKGQYRLYRRASRIVAISGAVKAAIAAQEPAVGAKTTVIPLPVDLELFGRGPATSGQESGDRKLLYVGRVHPEKGLALLVGAFTRLAERFPKWRVEVVGPVSEIEGGGGESYLEHLLCLAEGRRIEFLSPIYDPEALAAVYRSSDLFCYPSLAEYGEAFGVAALESMASGVPPVVSDLACFREFLRENGNGWIFDHRSPRAEETLAAVLERPMADQSLRERAGREARRDAERFGFAAVARQYVAQFELIMTELRGAARR